jgi:hypothetical protein
MISQQFFPYFIVYAVVVVDDEISDAVQSFDIFGVEKRISWTFHGSLGGACFARTSPRFRPAGQSVGYFM